MSTSYNVSAQIQQRAIFGFGDGSVLTSSTRLILMLIKIHTGIVSLHVRGFFVSSVYEKNYDNVVIQPVIILEMALV